MLPSMDAAALLRLTLRRMNKLNGSNDRDKTIRILFIVEEYVSNVNGYLMWTPVGCNMPKRRMS